MPRLGVGTAGRAGLGLAESLRQGVRLVDTASMYNNEELLANAFAGMQRSELFVVSKAWPFASSVTKSRSFNSPTKPSGELIADVTRHIAALNTSYLDLLLIHWPTAALREHWSALIELKARGLVRAIGLSNADVKHVQLLDGAEEPPALVQTELGLIRKDGRIPLASLEQLVEHCGRRGIRLMSHSPLKAALRNRKAQQFAKQLNVSVARLALRYGLERGLVQIFSSSKPAHILDNLRALYEPTLGTSILSELASWRLAPGEKMRAPRVAAVRGAEFAASAPATPPVHCTLLRCSSSLARWTQWHSARLDGTGDQTYAQPQTSRRSSRGSSRARASRRRSRASGSGHAPKGSRSACRRSSRQHTKWRTKLPRHVCPKHTTASSRAWELARGPCCRTRRELRREPRG